MKPPFPSLSLFFLSTFFSPSLDPLEGGEEGKSWVAPPTQDQRPKTGRPGKTSPKVLPSTLELCLGTAAAVA